MIALSKTREAALGFYLGEVVPIKGKKKSTTYPKCVQNILGTDMVTV